MSFLNQRPRRLRRTAALRNLISETEINSKKLIMPVFVRYGNNIKKPIASMPGQFQWSLDRLDEILKQIYEAKLGGVIFFGIPEDKDEHGSESLQGNGIIAQAIQFSKEHYPDLVVIADCCFCEYTSHGHCGIVNEKTGNMDVDNDLTLELLAKQAVNFVQAGADIIAPSGMMDNMVYAIREGLDAAGFSHLPILSYAVKYASSYYGPFREAAEGAPQFGDRRSYQMDPANAQEALKEAALDIEQGADMLMVKPAVNYLDILFQIKNRFPEYPLGAYYVSGEYAMLKAASQLGWLDEKKAALETHICIFRAGADFIITYYALEITQWTNQG